MERAHQYVSHLKARANEWNGLIKQFERKLEHTGDRDNRTLLLKVKGLQQKLDILMQKTEQLETVDALQWEAASTATERASKALIAELELTAHKLDIPTTDVIWSDVIER